MKSNLQLLDCTLRDGGLGLEDANKNRISDSEFSQTDIFDVSENLSKSKIDIVELGSVEITDTPRTGFAIYQNIEEISKTMPKSSSGQLYAALYRGPDTPLEDIPEWRPELCEVVRVIIRYSELQKSLDFCAGLSEKGYKVFVQPMLTMRYTDDEIKQLINAANDMGAYALYIVDSYGYMMPSDIERLFLKYDKSLDKDIAIGFHAHNNMNLAFSNALSFINRDTDRRLIVDSCALGMGQGAGNLQTEIIADHLNKNCGKSYDYGAVLDVCEIIQKYCGEMLWGYSVTRLLPAIHKTAYKYAVSLRKHYKLTYREINDILGKIPADLVHRYTPENTKKILELCGYDAEQLMRRQNDRSGVFG